MSDIETLGAQVRAVAEQLAQPESNRAASRLREAHSGLTSALTTSVDPAGVAQLARAREHVNKAMSRLRAARQSLDEYLVSIGVESAGGTTASTSAVQKTSVAEAGASTDWWRQRVNMISDGDAKTEAGDVAVPRLFSQLVDRAKSGDREGYRERLLTAGAANGSKLPGLAWPLIRDLATEVLGHAPSPKDDQRLRRLALDRVSALLPKLPDNVALAHIRRACNLPHVHRDGDEKPHPVDTAATGPILVAVLLRERGRVQGGLGG